MGTHVVVESCDACLEQRMDNVDGEPTHVDCPASNSAHHDLIRAERERSARLEFALGEIAGVLGDLARHYPELGLNEKAEARAKRDGSER